MYHRSSNLSLKIFLILYKRGHVALFKKNMNKNNIKKVILKPYLLYKTF